MNTKENDMMCDLITKCNLGELLAIRDIVSIEINKQYSKRRREVLKQCTNTL